MTLFIASDHAGFDLKQKIVQTLGHFDFKDLGPDSSDSVDYADYAHQVCERLLEFKKESKEEAFGILICGSGQGMVMSANRHPGIRAALCFTMEMAHLSREHNDANVLCLASRLVDESTNLRLIKAFLETPFAGGRHIKRVEKIELKEK